jgi:alpha-D-xyloside xylohydrolase
MLFHSEGGTGGVAEVALPTIPSPSAFMMWPVWHSRTVDEGSRAAAKAANKPELVGATWSLSRSVWAGSHLHQTIVWSGDVESTFSVLREQVAKGLNMMLTYPYWNTDTGGQFGDWQTQGELVVRWFQFSIFTSIVRLHGTRSPKTSEWTPLQEQCDPTKSAGGPVEPWAYGDGNHTRLNHTALIQQALGIRQALLPYTRTQLALLASHGQPVMRPLWYDFHQDETALGVADQFMYGSDYMVAPVLDEMPATGVLRRSVVFPGDSSVSFRDYFTQKTYTGGTRSTLPVDSAGYFPFFRVDRTNELAAAESSA